MGRGHRCPQRGGISDSLDVRVVRSTLRQSHAPGGMSKTLGQICQLSASSSTWGRQPWAAFCHQSRGQVGRGGWERGGADAGGTSGSPAAKSRMVQGISPPQFGREIWLRPAWPTAHRQLLLWGQSRERRTRADWNECFLTGRKLHTHAQLPKGTLSSPHPFHRRTSDSGTSLHLGGHISAEMVEGTHG